MIVRLPDEHGMRLLLRPNRSISWRALVRVWLGLVALTSVVVTGMTLIGAWLVIPFAGLELLAVGAGLWYTARKCSRQEVLTIGSDRLHLERGHQTKESEWEAPRQAVRIFLDPKPHLWAPERVWLCCRGEEVPLAEFLNPKDSRELVTVLESQGLRVVRRTPRYVGFGF